MKLLIKEKRKLHCKQQVCYICKKEFCTDDDNGILFNKNYHKLRDATILKNIEELFMIFVI